MLARQHELYRAFAHLGENSQVVCSSTNPLKKISLRQNRGDSLSRLFNLFGTASQHLEARDMFVSFEMERRNVSSGSAHYTMKIKVCSEQEETLAWSREPVYITDIITGLFLPLISTVFRKPSDVVVFC